MVVRRKLHRCSCCLRGHPVLLVLNCWLLLWCFLHLFSFIIFPFFSFVLIFVDLIRHQNRPLRLHLILLPFISFSILRQKFFWLIFFVLRFRDRHQVSLRRNLRKIGRVRIQEGSIHLCQMLVSIQYLYRYR